MQCSPLMGITEKLSPGVEVPAGLPLVAGLTGFADAGAAVAQTTEFLLETLENVEVAVFEVGLGGRHDATNVVAAPWAALPSSSTKAMLSPADGPSSSKPITLPTSTLA